MADPNTLQVGDLVTHPEWPAGTVVRVESISLFSRYDAKKRRAVPDPNVRIVWLAHPVEDKDGDLGVAWMEAGLILAAQTERRA